MDEMSEWTHKVYGDCRCPFCVAHFHHLRKADKELKRGITEATDSAAIDELLGQTVYPKERKR